MAQAISRRPQIMETLVGSRANLFEICGEKSGTGTGFLRVLRFSPVSIMSLMLHIYPFLYIRRD
jgi:hypothetical protein